MGAKELRLGPFVLHNPIGHGAMGVVWRGVHVAQQIPVAVKVLSQGTRWEEQSMESFRREVKAVARLHHPGVVMLLDYGVVSPEAARDPRAGFKANTPFIAMELAHYGSLDRFSGGALAWRALYSTLKAILQALSHAHARDIIHRDIKPANVLVFGQTPGQPDLRLTDFGIAHAVEEYHRSQTAEVTVGTPSYMAPEQFRGHWREYGPWTDLYAVGCMAYELATGDVPFQAETFIEHAYKHIKEEPPRLRPLHDLPADFEEWLRRLMRKNPAERFQCAADALWSLDRIAEAFEDTSSSILPGVPMNRPARHRSIETVATVACKTEEVWDLDAAPQTNLRPDHLHHALLPNLYTVKGGTRQVLSGYLQDLPPLPETWRMDHTTRTSMQLVGAGLGLYGLRTIPMVGREKERDRLWEALRKVGTTNRPHLLLLHGSAGVGKSRLAEWITQRAEEVGGAHGLCARHSPIAGLGDGLPRMIAAHLRCVGFGREETLEFVKTAMESLDLRDAQDAHALTEILSPAGREERGEAPQVHFHSPTERYALLERFFHKLTKRRPLILWLDDVQWGSDAIAHAEHLLNTELEHLPILLLLTVRSEALAERPLESQQIARILEHENAESLDLSPLDEAESRTLIGELLGLEGELAERLHERSGGNPLFAVQLVADWVKRGILEVGQTGFVLREGASDELPDNLYRVVETRLDRILEEFPPPTRTALELAAALGHEIDTEEWGEVCSAAGAQIPGNLVDTLLDHRLLQPLLQGWAFAHGLVREALERSARENERWPLHNLACAYMLSARYPDDHPGIQERTGLHYLEGMEFGRALGILQNAVEEHIQNGAYDRALDLLSVRGRAMTHLRLDASDVRLGQSQQLRARIFKLQGRLEDARGLAQQIETQARAHQWEAIHSAALEELGEVACIQGDMVRATNLYTQVMERYQAARDLRGQARILLGLGTIACQTGALSEARGRYQEARVLCRKEEAQPLTGHCLLGLGITSFQAGYLDAAVTLLNEALKIFEHQGDRSNSASCIHALADVARLQGKFAEAWKGYHLAMENFQAIGSGNAVHVNFSQGKLLLQNQEFKRAEHVLDACLHTFRETGERDDKGRTHAALLVCAAYASSWETWDAHLEKAVAFLQETHRADRDVAVCLEQAALMALQAQEHERARRAAEFARDHWERLEQPLRAAEIDAQFALSS